MSVVDVIRRRTETVAFERRAGVTVVDGFQVEGTPTTGNILAHVQQVLQKDLRNMPEGQRTQDWRKFWSDTQMFEADRLTVAGVEYRFQSVEFWSQGPFYIAMATKVDDLIP